MLFNVQIKDDWITTGLELKFLSVKPLKSFEIFNGMDALLINDVPLILLINYCASLWN